MKLIRRKKGKGFSILAVVLAMLILSIMGLTVGYLTAVGEISNTNQISSVEAYYIAQTGVEYSIKQIYDAITNTVNVPEPGITVGQGSFIVSQVNTSITITGRLGNANRVLHVSSPSNADCTPFDISHANLDMNDTLHHIYFNKTCLQTTVIDKMQMSWTPDNGEKIQKVRIENTYVYNNAAGQGSGEILELADYTVTNASQQEISKIQFNNTISGKIFTLTMIMVDGSTRKMNFGPV